MKIAIFCRGNCRIAIDTIAYFERQGMEISLLIIETGQSNTKLESVKKFERAHIEFNDYLYPVAFYKRTFRSIWQKVPTGIRFSLRKIIALLRTDHLKRLSKEMGIPFEEVRWHSSMETKLLLERYNISYILLTSSAWLIKEPLLSMNNIKIINAHCAKLPEHRSLDSLPWSVLDDDTIGLTAHFIDDGIDTGDILLFMEVLPQKGDNLITLRQRIDGKKPELFLSTVRGLQEGSIRPVKQKESEGVRHSPMTLSELIKTENVLQERLS